MKRHWKQIAKEILGEEKFKELEAINEATYDFGLSWLWAFEEHVFKPCAKDHDLVYLVADELIKLGLKELARRCVKQADKKFRTCCFKIADEQDSWFLKLQLKVFYKLVVIRRRLKFL